MRELIGRELIVDSVVELVLRGAEVLLVGPIGIGKTSVLEQVAARVQGMGRPCGFAPRVAKLVDVTRALADAYPDARAATQRQLRSILRRRAEERPAVILLDHVLRAPAATKNFVRSLRGTGTGVAFSIDTDATRDHAAARALRLTHREITLPPLGRRPMRKLLALELATARLELGAGDKELLLAMARGRPGWIVMLVARLRAHSYWRGERIRADRLRFDVSAEILERYVRANDQRSPPLIGAGEG